MPSILTTLRAGMRAQEIDFYWVPTSDEHLNEYVPEHCQRIKRLTGFSGSAGDLLVGLERAWLFVDGRYHIQVDQEVDGALFEVEKLGQAGAKSLHAMAKSLASESLGLRFAVDPAVISRSSFRGLDRQLRGTGAVLVARSAKLVDEAWDDRPAARLGAIERLSDEVTGRSVPARLVLVRERLKLRGAEATVVARLDQIAWLSGARGADIAFNPVFDSFLLLLPGDSATLYTHPEHIASLGKPEGLALAPISDFYGALEAAAREHKGCAWLVDPRRCPEALLAVLDEHLETRIVEDVDIIESLKAVKSPAELAGMAEAGARASAAKCRALAWLDGAMESGTRLTEAAFAERLESLYGEEEDYRGLSFRVIAARGPNAAIVHYSAPSPEAILEPGELFLIDSGAHYLGGTTDATRTVILGPQASPEQRRVFTLVLKGHLACAHQVFPEGSVGCQLDALTRAPLWSEGEDYRHGTGHGVGAFLNVHEGPMLIGMPGRGQMSMRPLEAGSVVSIEPGLYREGWGGVRIEGLYAIEQRGADSLGRERLAFRELTWIPLDRRLIEKTMLSPAEVGLVDSYHGRVLERIGACLDGEERRWLELACRPLED